VEVDDIGLRGGVGDSAPPGSPERGALAGEGGCGQLAENCAASGENVRCEAGRCG
jgi:hypothetical protein